MLYVLQYLAILAAFSLPFLIGGAVRFTKAGDQRKGRLCIFFAAAAAVVIALTVTLAFTFSGSAA